MLRGRNWHVFPTARKPEDVEALRAAGFEAHVLDYEYPETIASALAAVLERTGGKLDALYNNGAYAIPCALEDLATGGLRSLFESNFFGWHELTRQVVPVMRAQGHGRIVNCSSVLGIIAMKYRGAYTSSKFALEGYTDTLRQELMDANIKVSMIEPGPIDTRFTENALANFHRWIGPEGLETSPHKEAYHRRLKRMEAGEPGRFKLQADAVVQCLIHALEADRPKARYRVTVPTKVVAVLRRVLSTRMLDKFLMRGADSEE